MAFFDTSIPISNSLIGPILSTRSPEDKRKHSVDLDSNKKMCVDNSAPDLDTEDLSEYQEANEITLIPSQGQLVTPEDTALNTVATSVKAAAGYLLEASKVQLSIAKRRLTASSSLTEDIKIWKDFEDSSTIKAIAEICMQGMTLLANQSSMPQTPSYARLLATPPLVHDSQTAEDTQQFNEGSQILMYPKASIGKPIEDYFWDALYGKGVQVTAISIVGVKLTASLVDHTNAKKAHDLLSKSKVNDEPATNIFHIEIIAIAKYFIKTHRIPKTILATTSILNDDKINRDKLIHELSVGNPYWFGDRKSFEIADLAYADQLNKLPAGYIIKIMVNFETFKKYLKRRRQSIIIERLVTPSYPTLRPDLCFRCLSYGHDTETCSGKVLCRKCGANHSYNHTKCSKPKNCLNCVKHNDIVNSQSMGVLYDTNHLATSNSCRATMDRINFLIDEIRLKQNV